MQVYVNTSWVQMTQSKEKRASGSKNSDMALVDCVPVEAGKGNATRWVREKFGFPCERTMVAAVEYSDWDQVQWHGLKVFLKMPKSS